MSTNPRMQLQRTKNVDPSVLKNPSGPPIYKVVTSHKSAMDSRVDDSTDYKHAPWLLRRTSIHVESAPADLADESSDVMSISTTRSDEKPSKRPFLNRFVDKRVEEDHHDDASSIAPSTQSTVYRTTVSIEAGKPKVIYSKHSWLRELKSLEQAASIKLWAGTGKPAEVWGKLLKDPDLWDPTGDTLVYFSYERPQASFRINSSLLEATHSDVLIGKLQDGRKRTSSAPSERGDGSLQDFSNLTIGEKKRQAASLSSDTSAGTGSQVRYEIHFPPPDDYVKVDILRHHITTRNFFALLLKRPLVGLTFFQALVDLHSRLHLYLPQDVDCTVVIMQYLIELNLHNVCNDPGAAAGLLAWSEDPEVRWLAGWREGFVHCCGMFKQLRSSPEYHDISHASRNLLERSYLELGARVRKAEEKLSTFDLDEMWAGSEVQLHPSRAVFDQFRHFLQHFYAKSTKKWPPPKDQESDQFWLTRSLVWVLQKDFGALYNYHVDRGVVWSQEKEPGTSHRIFVREASGEPVEVNRIDVPLGKLFTRFDSKHKCPHIPHPYPLLPASAILNDKDKHSRPNFFRSKSKDMEKRTALAMAEASNSRILGPDVTTNSLLEAFLKFEKTDHLGASDSQDARRARWILLYGVLQILATISVDVPELCFFDGVSYFVNARLKGTPPWETGADAVFEEASPKASYCWKTAEAWGKG